MQDKYIESASIEASIPSESTGRIGDSDLVNVVEEVSYIHTSPLSGTPALEAVSTPVEKSSAKQKAIEKPNNIAPAREEKREEFPQGAPVKKETTQKERDAQAGREREKVSNARLEALSHRVLAFPRSCAGFLGAAVSSSGKG